MKIPLTRGYKRERGTRSKGLEKFWRKESIVEETLGNIRIKGKLW